jgi:hypothetical protein
MEKNKMLSITEYKKQFIDKQGKAPAVLLNKDGESLFLGDVQTVTHSNGRIKMKWRAIEVPDQWRSYTYIALLGNDAVQHLEEITPINFEGKPRNVEITFYE